MLGALLQKTAQPVKAIAHYQAALRLKPDFLVVYGNLVQVLTLADRLDEAVATARKGVEAANAVGNRAMADELDRGCASTPKGPQPARW